MTPPPHPDDDDTGPLRVPRPAWESRFDAPLTVNPRPVAPDRKPVLLLGAAALVLLLVIGGLAIWLTRRSGDDTDAPAAATPTTTGESSDDERMHRLLDTLPAGYPPDRCHGLDAPADALAKVDCGRNTDPGGPVSATYTVATDKAALTEAFDQTVRGLRVVNCPNNIQSPGPWRRNATPQQSAGMLVCGFDQDRPTVAWSTDSALLLSVVHGDAAGPDLPQLYAWWSTHS